MLQLRRFFRATTIASTLFFYTSVRTGHAQEPAAQPQAPAPAAPSAQPNTQDDIVDLSGQQIVAPSAAPVTADTTPAPQTAGGASAVTASSQTEYGPSEAQGVGAEPLPEPVRANAIHVSLLGLLGRFRLTYERLVATHHGIVFESILNPNLLDRISPETDDASDPKRFLGYGAGAGYRWHWRGEEGGFVSAMLALEHGSGSLPVLGDPDIRWSGTRTMLSITPAVGRRWIWSSGLSMVVRGGLGYAYQWIDHDPGLEQKAVDQYDNAFINVEGEVSLGYVF